jgi:hypothetical protein
MGGGALQSTPSAHAAAATGKISCMPDSATSSASPPRCQPAAGVLRLRAIRFVALLAVLALALGAAPAMAATAVPTLIAPTGSHSYTSPLHVEYTLPEEALAGSVTLTFEKEGTPTVLTLASKEGLVGAHSFELNFHSLLPNAAVVSMTPVTPNSLEDGEYTVRLSYQNAAAEPAAHVEVSKVTLRTPCEAGNYSATGEAPCSPAPAGYYAAGEGARSATPCPAGTNNPHMQAISEELCETDAPGSFSGQGAASPSLCEPGTFAASYASVECTSAPAGSFDEGYGASNAEPCPAGSYASRPRATQCTPTPAGTYATGGAAEPTPCPSGTEAPAGASSCKTVTDVIGGPGPIILPKITFTFAAPHRQSSLSRTRSQGYVLRCSATDTVSAHVSVTITLRHQRLRLQAPARTIACRAGVSPSEQAHFKLTGAAKRLLARRGVRLELTIALYPVGAGAKTALATGSVRGSR